jgi:hypothetical protein
MRSLAMRNVGVLMSGSALGLMVLITAQGHPGTARAGSDAVVRTAGEPAEDSSRETEMTVSQSPFGKTDQGQEVDLYTCVNARGLIMKAMTYGAIVVELHVPDRTGKLANINLGFDSLEGYLGDHPYFGATVGRYANRIAQGKFTLDGQEYTLATNNGPNHLHGGDVGFSRVVWQARPVVTDQAVGVEFRYTSPDGEEGYPGTVTATRTNSTVRLRPQPACLVGEGDGGLHNGCPHIPVLPHRPPTCRRSAAGGRPVGQDRDMGHGRVLAHHLLHQPDKLAGVEVKQSDLMRSAGCRWPVAWRRG